jgi:hypothetical protein
VWVGVKRGRFVGGRIVKAPYFLNHFVNVLSNFYVPGHVHPHILYLTFDYECSK